MHMHMYMQKFHKNGLRSTTHNCVRNWIKKIQTICTPLVYVKISRKIQRF